MGISGQIFIPPVPKHKYSDNIAEVNTQEEMIFVSVRAETETERLCRKT